jgi:hypothetical protein
MTRLCSVPCLLPSSWLKAGATQQRCHLWAAEQVQQALELTSVIGPRLGKSASIKSISDSIQSSNACSLSSCIALCSSSCSFRSSSFSRISLPGSRRQLSVAPKWRAALCNSVKNEWNRESDEPDAALLLEVYDVAEEVDVVIGGEEGNESNDQASDSLKHGWRIDRETSRLDLHRGRGHQFKCPNQQSLIIVREYLPSQGSARGALCLLPSSWLKAGATQQRCHLWAAEQVQQALELTSVIGPRLGKSASIKSISDSIQSSNACSLSSCSISLLSRLRSISRSILLCSAAGSRRQLSVAPKWRAALCNSVKNERKRDSDESDAPLLLHGDDASKEGDVVIGGEQRNQGNHNAGDGLNHSWRVDRATAWLGLHQRTGGQSRSPERRSKILVRAYYRRQGAGGHASRSSAMPSAPPTRRP